MIRKRPRLFLPAIALLAAAMVLFSLLPATAVAQPDNMPVKKIIALVDSFNAKLPSEKLYLHFDKPYYAVGDTMWFKAYLFQGATHTWSPSGLLYVELINDSDKLVKRMSFPVGYGISWGQIPLDADDVSSGRYTVYAYTNWMQNAGTGCFFHQRFAVGGAAGKYWLVKESHRVSAGDMSLAVQLSEADERPARGKDLRIKVVEGKKTLYHGDAQTGADGSFRTAFTLPQKTGAAGITLLAEDKSDPSLKVMVPLSVSRPENIDLQFMPEGGYLVAGLDCRVGFKAIGENGKGIDVKGKIVDSRDKEVLSFAAFHKGMGVFDLTPVAGETYTAVVVLPGSGPLRYPLPAVKRSGSVLRISDEGDSLHLSVFFTPDLHDVGTWHLLGMSRGLVCYGANLRPDKGQINGSIGKNVFPGGIAHFTLFNDEVQPLNERMLFIDQQDNLDIDISSDKPAYTLRDSIALHVQVKDKQRQPVTGSFSLAITDDAQVKTDGPAADNIITRLLLSSELKGTVEDPAWYLSSPGDTAVARALDALMLTQGWSGYDWTSMFKKLPSPRYAPEAGFMVTGRVTNLLNKPVDKANVLLMGTGKKMVFRDTVTNSEGRFAFYNFPVADTPVFIVEARNARGKNFGIGIEVDEFKPAQIHGEGMGELMPWYVNGDTALLSYVKNNYQRQQDALTSGGKYKLLTGVVVKGKKGIKGSANLNGPGEADQVIDADAIAKAGKMNLKQLMLQMVKGFRVVYGPNATETYRIYSNDLRIVIDGIPLARFGQQRETLEYLDASDIKGIEVMHSMRHSANYRSTFLTTQQLMNITKEYSFVEITTYSGNGIFLKHTPGVYVYKPLPVSWPVQFYAPRYTIKDAPGLLPDLRSTIFWQPNMVTDKQGSAQTAFYAADKPSTYTVIIQGSDMNGNIGYRMKKIVVSRQ